jgi:hypothetical protein
MVSFSIFNFIVEYNLQDATTVTHAESSLFSIEAITNTQHFYIAHWSLKSFFFLKILEVSLK